MTDLVLCATCWDKSNIYKSVNNKISIITLKNKDLNNRIISSYYGICTICIISLAMGLLCIHRGHEWGDDFAMYISQAKSILSLSVNELYEQNKYAMDNSSALIGPYLYPMGFPLIICLVYSWLGLNLVALKILCLSFFIGSVYILYGIINQQINQKNVSLAICALIAFHPQLIIFSDQILSDFPFLFFSLLSVRFIIDSKNTLLKNLVIGFLIFFSYLLRDTGIFLIAFLFIYQVKNYNIFLISIKARFVSALPYILFLFLFIVNRICLPDGGSNHLAEFHNITIYTVLENLIYYSAQFARFFIPLNSSYLYVSILIGGLFCIFTLVGIYSLRNINPHFIVYTVLMFLVYTIWPSRQGIRFLIPIIPFLLYFTYQGILYVKTSRYLSPVLYLYVLYILLSGIFQTIDFYKRDPNEVLTTNTNQLYDYIKANTTKKDVIVFFKPRALRLFTERNAIYQSEPAKIISSDAAYLVGETGSNIENTAFLPVFSNAQFTLYKISRSEKRMQ